MSKPISKTYINYEIFLDLAALLLTGVLFTNTLLNTSRLRFDPPTYATCVTVGRAARAQWLPLKSRAVSFHKEKKFVNIICAQSLGKSDGRITSCSRSRFIIWKNCGALRERPSPTEEPVLDEGLPP